MSDYGVNLIPYLTSNTTPGGVASASSSYGAGAEAFQAFNAPAIAATSGWRTTALGVVPCWVRYQFATATVADHYSIRGYSGATYSPRTWKLQGSNDGTSWTDLDTQTNVTFLASEYRDFPFTNTTAYAYYQHAITANNGGATTIVCSFELRRSLTAPSAADDMELLRIIRHGQAPTDLESSDTGGFTDLVHTEVRNDPGSLECMLTGVSPASVFTVVNEASAVEFWRSGARVGRYIVDDISPRWGALECSLRCTGLLLVAAEATISAPYSDTSDFDVLKSVVRELEAYWRVHYEPSGFGLAFAWSAENTTIEAAIAVDLISTWEWSAGDSILSILQSICGDLRGCFWADEDGEFRIEVMPDTVTETFTLGADCHEVDVTYTRRTAPSGTFATGETAIANRVTFATTDQGNVTYNETASQALYGVWDIGTVDLAYLPDTVDWLSEWVARYFEFAAWHTTEMKLTVTHDAGLRPGLRAELVGLEDGRTHAGNITQVTHALGAIVDEVILGVLPAVPA